MIVRYDINEHTLDIYYDTEIKLAKVERRTTIIQNKCNSSTVFNVEPEDYMLGYINSRHYLDIIKIILYYDANASIEIHHKSGTIIWNKDIQYDIIKAMFEKYDDEYYNQTRSIKID